MLPFRSHELRAVGLMCATTLEPGGASGVDGKSNSPNKNVCAEMFGFVREGRSMLSVRIDCVINRSHSQRGKDGSHVANPALKCDLKVCMARSAKFVRCICGGAS